MASREISACSTADTLIGKSHLENLLENSPCDNFQDECEATILEVSSLNETAVANAENPDSDTDLLSPIARLNLGQTEMLRRRDTTVNSASIIALYRKTVDATKVAVERSIAEKKSAHLRNTSLVGKLCDADPTTFVTAMVKKNSIALERACSTSTMRA